MKKEVLLIFILMGSLIFAGDDVPANLQVPVLEENNVNYLAYANTKKGEFPLPEKLDNLAKFAGKHLTDFRWADYNGPRIRVGVLEVKNSTKKEYDGLDGDRGIVEVERIPVSSIDALVINSLVNTGRFTLVEREIIEKLVEEQDRKTAGLVTTQSGAKSGRMLGARYLIKVIVTEYEPTYKKKSFGLGAVSGGFLGGVGVGVEQSMVSLTFRLVDPESSEIIFSKKAMAVIDKKGFGVGGGKSKKGKSEAATFSSMSQTPIGNAVIAAINVGVFELVKAIGNPSMKAKVVLVKDGNVILNRGQSQVQVGDTFRAFIKGDEFVDPETGISLGSETEEVGSLEVSKVMPRFCYARAIGFQAEELARGDEAVSNLVGEDFHFAKAWLGPYPKTKKYTEKRRKKKAEKKAKN